MRLVQRLVVASVLPLAGFPTPWELPPSALCLCLTGSPCTYNTLTFGKWVVKFVGGFWFLFLCNCLPTVSLNTYILCQQQVALYNVKINFHLSFFQRLNCSRNCCPRWWGLNPLGRSWNSTKMGAWLWLTSGSAHMQGTEFAFSLRSQILLLQNWILFLTQI